MHASRGFLLALALIAGCARPPQSAPAAPAPDELAWVAKDQEGNPQCDRNAPPIRPLWHELVDAGIDVHDPRYEQHPTCDGCDCRSVSTRYARIARRHLPRALRLGWEPRDPPAGPSVRPGGL